MITLDPFRSKEMIYSRAINISLDLIGKPDPDGFAGGRDSFASPILFHPPAKYRTRILRVRGDFIAWPKSGTIPAGTSSEVGWGLKTTGPDGPDTLISYPGYTATPFINSFIWLQGFLTPQQPGARLEFDQDVSAGGLLDADNTMLSQAFVALNTTGLTIHMEHTYVIEFTWVKL